MNIRYQLLLNQFVTVIFVLTGEELTGERGEKTVSIPDRQGRYRPATCQHNAAYPVTSF